MIEYTLAGLLTLLQIADVFTTYNLVKDREADEGNPIMVWCIKKLGLLPGLIVPKLIIITLFGYLFIYYRQLTVAAMIISSGFYVWVIYNNTRLRGWNA